MLQFFPGFSTIQRIFKISKVSKNVKKPISCPLFVSLNPHTFYHPHTSTLEQPAEPSQHARKCIPPTEATLHPHNDTHHSMTHTTLPKRRNHNTTPIHNGKKRGKHTQTPLQGHCFFIWCASKTPCLTTLCPHTDTFFCTLQPTLQPQMLHTHIYNTSTHLEKNSRNLCSPKTLAK